MIPPKLILLKYNERQIKGKSNYGTPHFVRRGTPQTLKEKKTGKGSYQCLVIGDIFICINDDLLKLLFLSLFPSNTPESDEKSMNREGGRRYRIH